MKRETLKIDVAEARGLFGMLSDAEAGAVIKALMGLPCDDQSRFDDRAVQMAYYTLTLKAEKEERRQAEISQKRRQAIAARWHTAPLPSESPEHSESSEPSEQPTAPTDTNEYKCIQAIQMYTNDTNVSEKDNEKETFPPTPPIKEKDKEKETLPPPSKKLEGDPMPGNAAQLRATMSLLLGKFATGTITQDELCRLRTQKRNGNLDRLGLRWNDPPETEPSESSERPEPSESPQDLKTPKKRFVRPTLAEVQRYVAEKNLNVDPDEFYDHFTSNGWKVGGKAPMKDWKCAANNWHRRENKRFAARAPTANEEAEEWKRMASTPESIDLSDLTS